MYVTYLYHIVCEALCITRFGEEYMHVFLFPCTFSSPWATSAQDSVLTSVIPWPVPQASMLSRTLINQIYTYAVHKFVHEHKFNTYNLHIFTSVEANVIMLGYGLGLWYCSPNRSFRRLNNPVASIQCYNVVCLIS